MTEQRIITLDLAAADRNWRPDPFPGSECAFERGCTCPVHQPWPGALAFAAGCPIHELEPVPH